MDIEKEISDLKRRVGDLEGAVNVLTGQLGNVHPALIEFKDLAVHSFDTIGMAMDRFVTRLDTMNAQVWSLRDDLPALIGDAVRKSRGTGHGN